MVVLPRSLLYSGVYVRRLRAAAGEDRRIARPRIAPAWRPPIEAEGELREKKQLTLPKTIVQALNLSPGDRLVLRVQDDGAESIVMYPLRASNAGAL